MLPTTASARDIMLRSEYFPAIILPLESDDCGRRGVSAAGRMRTFPAALRRLPFGSAAWERTVR